MTHCIDTLKFAIGVCDAELAEAQALARARVKAWDAAGARAADERGLAVSDVRSKLQRALHEAREGDLGRARAACAEQGRLMERFPCAG